MYFFSNFPLPASSLNLAPLGNADNSQQYMTFLAAITYQTAGYLSFHLTYY